MRRLRGRCNSFDIGITVRIQSESLSALVGTRIQQGVQLHSRLGRAEWRPRKYRQTQIDGRRVERVDGILEINAECVVGIGPPGPGPDAPIPRRIGIGQRVPRDDAAKKTGAIELSVLRPQACLDVAQALAIGQLRERHRQVLVEAREPLDLVLAVVARHAAMVRRKRQVFHHLGEYIPTLVHRPSPPPPDRWSG